MLQCGPCKYFREIGLEQIMLDCLSVKKRGERGADNETLVEFFEALICNWMVCLEDGKLCWKRKYFLL